MKFQFLKAGILLMLLGAFSISGYAQEITLKGKVSDKVSSEALQGATLMVATQGAGTFSNENGTYEFKVKSEDTIVLSVRYIGYETVEIRITPVAGKTIYTNNIEIKEEGVLGEEVVITAGRHEQNLSEVTVSMEVIKPKAIDLQATNEIEDVLQQISGVDIIDGQPNIRGSSGFAFGVGSRVMVMMDGLPLLSADASFAQFDIIPLDNIAQVEVMKGASSVLYGSSALGGVINVIMADAPTKPKTSIRFKQSFFDKPANPDHDWDGKKSAYITSLHGFHARRIKNNDLIIALDLIKNSGYRKGTDTEEARLVVLTKFRPKKVPGMTWGINGTAKIDSSGSFLYWDSYHRGEDTTDSKFYGGALVGDSTLRKQLLSRYTVDPYIKYLTPKGNLHSYRGRYMGTVNRNSTDQESNNGLFFNDYQYLTKIWKDKVSWVSGGTFIFNKVKGDSLYGGNHHSMNIAVYTQMDAEIIDRLNVTLGARYDYWIIDGEQTEQSPVFRVGANYNTWAGNNIRASFGQGFRSPSIAERYTSTVGGGLIIEPNPGLIVEKGFSTELAMRQGFKFGTGRKNAFGFLDVAAFMMQFDNMIEFGVSGVKPGGFPPEPIFSATNIANTRIMGVEVSLMTAINLGDVFIELNGGITILDPKNRNPTPDSALLDFLNVESPADAFDQLDGWLSGDLQDNPEYLKYRNTTTIRGSATLGHKKLSITANYQMKSLMKHIDQYLYVAIKDGAWWQNNKAGTYHLINAIVAYQVTPKLKVSGHVNNIFQEEYVVLPGIMAEQRKFTIQLKYVF